MLAAALVLTSCGSREQEGAPAKPAPRPKPRVAVATTTMLADLVRQVGGVHFEVVGLMGPGVDPHLYAYTTGDLQSMQRSRVIFYNGLHLEGRMGEIFETMRGRGKVTLAVAEQLPKETLLLSEGQTDPHVWGDVRHWIQVLDVVAKALGEADPENASAFQANADRVKAEWTALHEWARKRCAEIPAERRVLLTSHDAFAYFGKAYGLEVVGVQGLSTSAEAGLADITRAVDFIRERKLPAVFVESSVPHAVIERIARDAGVKLGGELFSDACGIPGKTATVNGETYDLGTYAGMIRHNVNTIVEALK
jgi:manganese/zinc/iron transport system substrate-binding protein